MPASAEQLHKLLMYCIDFARTMLQDSGEFYPFGAHLSSDEKLCAIGGYNGEEHPNPKEIYQLLCDGFAKGIQDGTLLGIAVAANVNIPAQYSPAVPDGLRVHLESDGFSRHVYVPYRLTRQGATEKPMLEFLEPFSVEIPPTFFSGVG